QLALEIDEALEHRLDLTQLLPGGPGLLRTAYHHLALTVVTEACGLEHGRHANGGDRRLQLGLAAHGVEWRQRKAPAADESLLPQAILDDVQYLAAGPHRHVAGGAFAGQRGHVLELEADHVDFLAEGGQRVEILVRGLHFLVGDLTGRGVPIRRVGMDPVAHTLCRQGEHAAQLAAAQNPENGTRRDDLAQLSLSSRTRWACAVRNSCSLQRKSGRLPARMEIASSAALRAPATPMAMVATGMPAGICRMDSNESMPCSALVWIGTPMTGSTVCEATMPGR